MPTYEYLCEKCEKILEIFHKLNDPQPPCPGCGGDMQKLISKSSFQLKGSGFYVNDYKRRGR